MQIDRSAAALLRVQVDLPELAQRVGLDEVTLVVDVKAVIDRMVLELGDVTGDIDDGHPAGEFRRALAGQPARYGSCHGRCRAPQRPRRGGRCGRRFPRGLDDWGLAGTRRGQYRSDLVADEAAVRVLTAAGLGVLSEESGFSADADGSPVARCARPR